MRTARTIPGEVYAALTEFAEDLYGQRALDEAWDEFVGRDDDPPSDEHPLVDIFVPWFVFGWQPTPASRAVGNKALHGLRPAAAFLRQPARPTGAALADALALGPRGAFEFHEVVAVADGVTLRSLWSGAQHVIAAADALPPCRPGDLVYALLGALDDGGLVLAASALVLPPAAKPEVVAALDAIAPAAARQASPGDAEAVAIRRAHRALVDRLLNPGEPVLRNSSGHVVVLQTLVYDVDSAQCAYDALRPLETGIDAAQTEARVARGPGGEVVEAALVWCGPREEAAPQPGPLILGQIHIDHRRLRVEVNSDERAEAFRQIAARALGGAARYRGSEPTAGAAVPQPAAGADPRRAAQQQRLLDAAMNSGHPLEAYYRTWIDAKLPVLGGLSPRQAAMTPDGRQQVAGLLRQIEAQSAGMALPPDPRIFARLREQLGFGAERG